MNVVEVPQQEATAEPIVMGLPLSGVVARLWAGESVQDIAESCGKHRTTLERALTELGVKPVQRWTLETITAPVGLAAFLKPQPNG